MGVLLEEWSASPEYVIEYLLRIPPECVYTLKFKRFIR